MNKLNAMQTAVENDEASWDIVAFNSTTEDYSRSTFASNQSVAGSTASAVDVSACFDLIVQAHRDGEDAFNVFNVHSATADGVCTNVIVPEALVLPPPEVVLKGHVLIVMSSLALIANGTMLIIFYRRNYLKLSNYYLVFFLALFDIMVATFCMLADGIWKLTFQWYGGWLLCKAVKYFQMFSLYGSTYLLIAICCDRFIAIRWPHISRLRGRALARIMIGCALLCSTVFAVPQALIFDVQFGPFFVRFQQCVVSPTVDPELLSYYHFASFFLQCAVPITTIVVVYALLFWTLWLESRRSNIMKIKHKGSRNEQPSRCSVQIDNASSVNHNSVDDDENNSNSSISGKHLRTTSLYYPKSLQRNKNNSNTATKLRPRLSISNAEAMPYRSSKHNPLTTAAACSIVICADQDDENVALENGPCFNGNINKTASEPNGLDCKEDNDSLQPHTFTRNGNGFVDSLSPARTARKDVHHKNHLANKRNSAASTTSKSQQRREHRRLSESQSSVSGRRQELMRKAMSRSLLMSILIIGVFIVCWAPYYADMYMFLTNSDNTDASPAFSEGDDGLIFFFGMMSSLINPIIYGVFLSLRRKSTTARSTITMPRNNNNVKKDSSRWNVLAVAGSASGIANGLHGIYDSRQTRQEHVRQQYLAAQRTASIASNNSSLIVAGEPKLTTRATHSFMTVPAATATSKAAADSTAQPSLTLRVIENPHCA